MPQTKLILRNYAALAVLTVAVIAVEFLPTGASAQNQIIHSLRPSGINQPPPLIYSIACDTTNPATQACINACWARFCGAANTTCTGANLPLFYDLGPVSAVARIFCQTKLETTHYPGVGTHEDI
jgi:hypothetical protein